MVREMKKQHIAFIYILLLLLGAIMNVYKEPLSTGAEQQGSEPVVIPEEAIRLRILANSDSDEDQALKRKIRDEVNKEITVWVEKLTSIEAARELIQSRLPEIEEIVQSVLVKENKEQEFSVDFDNVSFPTKMYGSYIYPAGDYEAILITLGEGKGANWWCVLFPPLCFLDFSNGQAVQAAEIEEEDKSAEAEKTSEELSALIVDEEEEKEEVEVKFFLVEWFSNLFS
jgi:stage II sporulation protein R